MDKSKQNHSMYSLQLRRSGQVSIHLSKLEVSRVQNTETLTQVERQLASVNTDISFEKSQFQGFWIAVRNGIDISIGRIGDKIINPVANYSDVIREGRDSGDCPPKYLLAANLSRAGPEDPYYFGLTVSDTTTADFGVNCDMPGLHYEDTCVTDDDCADFPNTGGTLASADHGTERGVVVQCARRSP